MSKKKMTIDDLVVMTKNGFDEVHKDMDDKFKLVDKRFEQAVV